MRRAGILLEEREWRVLRDCDKPPIERQLPRPGDSPVWDWAYDRMSKARLIRWVQKDPFCQSLSDDHYVFIGNWEKLLGVSLPKS